MSYVRKLTFNLRVRGLSEPEIADVLDDVRAHGAATGTAAEATFGTAEEYAKQFAKKKRRTRGSIITMVGLGIALAYVLVVVLLMLLFRSDVRDFVGPVSLLPATEVILACVLAGFLTDYFQPAQSSRG
ncbi:hypothetical protein NFC73_11700 [Pseudarthrobacter sp. RMG13]|uniref:DUF1700 domain-containing protein n=1 Tax=Pseudarthrobacter humi TaxID=2952523 RepID=A0ABT1LPL0_9MICC|nr:hypothetical protein [Pseudarthrobacter humi]MCP9000387.1 hypothetical protein [Pseudarthrobacter humi]